MSTPKHWIAIALLAAAAAAHAAEWTTPVEVRHEDELAIAYQARLEGDMLIVRATLGPGWHTFAMDNKRRVDEKLAGKPPLSVDRPTEILASGALQPVGTWLQSPPKDFSRPELRWFSWGFEGQAVFATKVRRTTAGPARLTLRGQACTASVCKNLDLALTVPAASNAASTFDTKSLIEVRK
jgi:hypothetical protein